MFNYFTMPQMYFLYMYYLFCRHQAAMQNLMRNMMQFMSQNMMRNMTQFMPQDMIWNMTQFMPQNMIQNPEQGMTQNPMQNTKQFMDPDFLLQHADLQKLLQIDMSPENLDKLQQFLEFFFDTCSRYRRQR